MSCPSELNAGFAHLLSQYYYFLGLLGGIGPFLGRIGSFLGGIGSFEGGIDLFLSFLKVFYTILSYPPPLLTILDGTVE